MEYNMVRATRRKASTVYILAVLCGIISGIFHLMFFESFYTYVSYLKGGAWVGIFPSHYQGMLITIHFLVVEMIFLSVVVCITIALLGLFIRKERFFIAFTSYISFTITNAVFNYLAMASFPPPFSALSLIVLKTVITFFLFLGNYLLIDFIKIALSNSKQPYLKGRRFEHI